MPVTISNMVAVFLHSKYFSFQNNVVGGPATDHTHAKAGVNGGAAAGALGGYLVGLLLILQFGNAFCSSSI